MAGLSDQSNDGLPEDTLKEAIRAQLVNVFIELPGTIVSFDPVNQTADVQIALMRSLNGQIQPISVLHQVPVQFYRAGGFIVKLPVKAGDGCSVKFSQRSIDKWFILGGVVDPADTRMFDLSDAIIEMGLEPLPNKIVNFDPDKFEIMTLDGTTSIQIDPSGEIKCLNPIGSSKIAPSGEIELKNASGTLTITPAGKFSFEGVSEELLDLIEVLINVLKGALVQVFAGVPFTPATIAALEAVRVRLLTLKV